MRQSNAIRVVAILAILAASAVIFVSGHEFAPRFDPRPHAAAGWGMARLALSTAGAGAPIILICRDTSIFKQPAADAQLAAFKQAIRDAHGTISVTHALQLDPVRPVEVPSGDFFEWIRKAPAGSVIVSLVGPPVLTDLQRTKVVESKAKIVAFCPGSIADRVNLRALFDQHLLDGAIIGRRDITSGTAIPSGLQGCLDAFFVTVTANNIASLFSATGARL